MPTAPRKTRPSPPGKRGRKRKPANRGRSRNQGGGIRGQPWSILPRAHIPKDRRHLDPILPSPGGAMTIYERALDFVSAGDVVGLGSGRASMAFIQVLGERVANGLSIKGVPTSRISEELAHNLK